MLKVSKVTVLATFSGGAPFQSGTATVLAGGLLGDGVAAAVDATETASEFPFRAAEMRVSPQMSECIF